jgi:nicotinamide-nucleotide amidase
MSLRPIMVELKDLLTRNPKWTLAAAESLTCGFVQAGIGSMSGASEFFAGGITAYNIDQKVHQLGVDRAVAEPVNCVSQQVAEQMARGVCRLFGTDVGVATTGYAEPVPELGVTEPFAWWAVAHRQGSGQYDVRSGRTDCPGMNREQAQACITERVLSQLRDYLVSARG